MIDKESKHTLKCAWKSFEGTFCPEAERLLKAQKEENKKLKQALREIRQLLEDALDTDKTNVEQSFDNFYKAIELSKVTKKTKH